MKHMLTLAITLLVVGLGTPVLSTTFNFSDGTNQGWSIAGFYDDESLYPLGVCADFPDSPLRKQGAACRFNSDCDVEAVSGFPPPVPGKCEHSTGRFFEENSAPLGPGGYILLGGGGFSTIPFSPTGGEYVHWDFVSPDLSSDTMWQGIDAFSFAVSGSEMASAFGKAFIEAVMHVRKPDGTDARFMDGVPHEIPINQSAFEPWATHIVEFDRARIPAGSTLLHIRLRVWLNVNAGYDGFILVDDVIPNPSRESPRVLIVDGAAGRNPGEFQGILPEISVALAQTDTSGQDVLPLGSDDNQDPPGAGAQHVRAIFDTGSTSVAFGPPHFGCTTQPGSPCLSQAPLPQRLDIRINGLRAIDPVTGLAPLGPPAFPPAEATVPSILVGSFPRNRVLIGAPVATRVRAIIDNRSQARLTRMITGANPNEPDQVTGPNIVFNPAASAIFDREKALRLRLQRFGLKGLTSKGATQDQRYYLRNVTLRADDREISDNEMRGLDKGLRFFWDSATTFTILSRDVATALGLLDRPEGRDFPCEISESILDGYELDSIDMYGTTMQSSHYTIQNARICVEDDDGVGEDDSPAYNVLIGSNVFDQVRILFDGPADSIYVLTDPADLDSNYCVDRADHQLLMAELHKPAQVVNISGYAEVGSFESGPGQGELGPLGSFTYVEFNADSPVEITSVTYNFTGTDVSADANGGSILNADGCCEDSFKRIPEPFDESTQVIGFVATGFGPEENFAVGWDLDRVSEDPRKGQSIFGDFNIPSRSDYFGATVTATFSDGSSTRATFNSSDSTGLARNTRSAAARFSLTIPNFKEPPDPTFDLNEDGVVNNADEQTLIGLFNNPGGLPCN